MTRDRLIGRVKILVLEDDRKLAALVRKGLEAQGFSIDFCDNGDDAYALATTRAYDALVLDVMLPRVDGLTVCRRIRRQGRRSPILILSARDLMDDRVQGLDAGADDYVAKPFHMEEVLARIRAVDTLEPDAGPARGNGPAVYYRYPSAAGTVGVITPMTHTYCERCNRVRLTADGRLRTCLFGDHEVLLRDAIRNDTPLGPLFLQALAEKPKAHELLQMRVGGLRALSQVGG